MDVPLVDLKAQYEAIKDEVDAAIRHVINTASFIMGEEVFVFERQFADYIGVKHSCAVSSGTDALHLALLSCGVGPGDEVIAPVNTFVATAEAISHCGAAPVFVDIDPKTYNIDVSKVEERITTRTKAIVPVHLYGQPAELEALVALARRYGLRLVEDAAQAHGAEYRGRRVGGYGDAGCFSFYPGKNLGAYGDAGMVTTDDDEIARRIRLLRNHGRESKYLHLVEGYADRMDTIQAAILSAKLRHLDRWNERRRRLAHLYSELLSGSEVICPYEAPDVYHVYHAYVIRTARREELRRGLQAKGIATGVHYPIPLHLQPAYARLGYRKGAYPVAEQCADEFLSLPMFPELTEGQVHRIVEAIKRTLNGR